MIDELAKAIDGKSEKMSEAGERILEGAREALTWAKLMNENAALTARVAELEGALEKCLNYIENTEAEFSVTMPCGEAARAALAKKPPDAL